MKTYVALLRGINVSGKNKINMADLKAMLASIGLSHVKTYIQSGNVVFKAEETAPAFLEKQIEKGIADAFKLEVPVLVRSKDDVQQLVAKNPFMAVDDIPEKGLYYVFLKQSPNADVIAEFEATKYLNEDFLLIDTCVYLYVKNGYGKAKLNANVIARKLKVVATARNHKTMLRITEMVAEI